jgi:uncharacterized protein (TIGR03000 family)
MYSVILMAAMTASAPEAPSFGIRARLAAGCVGACSGYVVGYACGGCYGYACFGCGGCVGFYRPGPVIFWPRWRPFYWGVFRPGPVWVVSSDVTTPLVIGPYVSPISGDVWGASYYPTGKTPFVPVAPPEEKKKSESDPKTGGRSQLILEVPANAQVFVDGQPTKSTSAVRHFYTPQLDAGQDYFYDVKVVVPTTDDKPPVEWTRRVYVRANQVVRERFDPSADQGIAQRQE